MAINSIGTRCGTAYCCCRPAAKQQPQERDPHDSESWYIYSIQQKFAPEATCHRHVVRWSGILWKSHWHGLRTLLISLRTKNASVLVVVKKKSEKSTHAAPPGGGVWPRPSVCATAVGPRCRTGVSRQGSGNARRNLKNRRESCLRSTRCAGGRTDGRTDGQRFIFANKIPCVPLGDCCTRNACNAKNVQRQTRAVLKANSPSQGRNAENSQRCNAKKGVTPKVKEA